MLRVEVSQAFISLRHTETKQLDFALRNRVARHPGLRDFEQCAANPIMVTNADLIVRRFVHREVLAELSNSCLSQ
jgi:hypothetical protein